MPENLTKLYLLSGFFGSGKTTLLNRIISGNSFFYKNNKNKKIGLIINEFGGVSTDAPVIREANEALMSGELYITELNDGSIFCACLKKDFQDALIECSKRGLDFLIIECSGMAAPSSVERLLSDMRLVKKYEYCGAICVADALRFIAQADIFPVLEHQVSSASVILINKTDLATQSQAQATKKAVRALNPHALIEFTSYCDIDLALLESLTAKTIKEDSDILSYNTPENRPETVTIVTGENIIPYEKLKEMLTSLPLIRAKGFVMTEKGLYFADLTQSSLKLTKAQGKQQKAELVLIAPQKNNLTKVML